GALVPQALRGGGAALDPREAVEHEPRGEGGRGPLDRVRESPLVGHGEEAQGAERRPEEDGEERDRPPRRDGRDEAEEREPVEGRARREDEEDREERERERRGG